MMFVCDNTLFPQPVIDTFNLWGMRSVIEYYQNGESNETVKQKENGMNICMGVENIALLPISFDLNIPTL
ncbi:unnamed protein product [Acanthoscelides obtectus]|uniref:Uncharacterized protein n=1 Tax=Acanthoscelides obtectus TaxID=200917 RepID=A0A9P0LTM0_ACAOB|nr:unnamed protein product [Acanthoscelides obtectus]CAK1651378.1 hypothetical protein AOBTE_LOCUS17236 [Acanthoscelides obtectus]